MFGFLQLVNKIFIVNVEDIFLFPISHNAKVNYRFCRDLSELQFMFLIRILSARCDNMSNSLRSLVQYYQHLKIPFVFLHRCIISVTSLGSLGGCKRRLRSSGNNLAKRRGITLSNHQISAK